MKVEASFNELKGGTGRNVCKYTRQDFAYNHFRLLSQLKLQRQSRFRFMSKKTFIPKWPGCNNASSGFMNDSKFKRYKTKLDGIGNAMTIRTLQEGRRNVMNAPWNHNVPDTEDFEDGQDKNRNANKAPKGRVIQRVGMFRNAKQSQIIYNNVSTAVRRMVDRDIEELVAPESDVQWAPNINAVSLNYGSNREEKMEREGNQYYEGAFQKQARRKDEFLNADVMNILTKRRRYAELVSDLNFGLPNNPEYQNPQQSNFVFTTPDRQGCAASDENFYNADPNNNICNSNNNINTNANRSETFPYPSETLSQRMLATLPTLGLTDDDRRDYDTVALRMLTDSINGSATSTTSESKMLASFMNKTQALNISCDDSRDFAFDADANQHEFLIPSSPSAESSSGPTTPPLEREFNQTIVFPVFNIECNDILTPRVVPIKSPFANHQPAVNAETYRHIEGEQEEALYSYDEMDENQLAESHHATEAVANFWPFGDGSASGQEPEPDSGYNWMNAWEEKSSYF